MTNANVDDVAAAPARLPRWRTITDPRSDGRRRSDWALMVPIPGRIAAHREVLFTRFGETVPLVHCLQSRLVSRRPTADAVIAVAEVLYTEVKVLLAANGVSVDVVSVPGRGTLHQCLSEGLARLSPTTQYVLVHDIHRPLASNELADRILDGLRRGSDVVIPALAMVDSVKTVDAAGAVTETVDRSLLRSAQFPRGFSRQHLANVLAAVGVRDDFDELILARSGGVSPTLVEGDPDAFALDIPRDIGLADAIHACRVAELR